MNPLLNKGKWTLSDSIRMVTLVTTVGRKWAFISRAFNCMRSEHSVKNHFKKLLRDVLKIKDEDHHKRHQEVDKNLLEELKRRKAIRDANKEEEAKEDEFEEGDERESGAFLKMEE